MSAMKFNFRNLDVRRTLGWVFISLAIAGSIFFVYEQVWTNHVAHNAARQHAEFIKQDWEKPAAKSTPDFGDGFGLLYIPRLKKSVWGLPISHGTEPAQLDVGVGHYVKTALPDQVGNFALAAHRSTHGEPFAHFEDLRIGDRVYVQLRDKWIAYELDFDAQVTPDEAWVLDKDPAGMSNKVGTDKLLTLTTCTPRYGSSGRWIWWGHQVATSPGNKPPSEVK